MKSGNLLRGRSLYLGGKFLSKAYLGFVIADLVTRIKTFQLGDKDQILGIVGDSAILAINTVSAGLEIFSAFATVEEASVELGPEVLIAEALIFTIVDGFYAAKSVQKIEQEIVLSWSEKFVQWWRSFFGARTSEYIDQLIREKILIQKAVDEMVQKLLLLNQTFDYYASPTLYINDKNRVQQTEDNLIIMDNIITVESRVWPESKDNFKVECASDGYEKNIFEINKFRVESDRLGFTTDGTIHKSIFCRNMVSVSIKAKNAEMALIELGTGQDTALGFANKKNYFIVAGGKKHITGGRYADTFVFIGNSTKILGEIDGLDGRNVLDLSQYIQAESFYMDMLANELMYSDNTTLIMKGVEHIIGRSGSSDRVRSSCRTKFLDLKGGKSYQNPDLISVPDLNCDQNFTIKLSGHIQVNNIANTSNVLYLVPNGTNAQINTVSSSIFLLSVSLIEVDSLQYENYTWKIKSTLKQTKLIVHDPMHESKFIFSDQFQVTFLESNFHAKFQNSDSNLVNQTLIDDFLLFSRKLSLIITVISDQKIMHINNLRSSVQSRVVHFKNDPYHETEIVTVDHEEIFLQLDANCNFQKMECHMCNVSIHVFDIGNSSNVIVDLSTIYTLFRENHQELILNIENSTNHLLVGLQLKNQTFSRIEITYKNFMLKNTLCSKISMNIKVLMQVCYDSDQQKFILSPIPIKVSTNDSIIVLSKEDIVENMEISIQKQITSITCRSFKNSLILANDHDLHHKDALTLILIDYYHPLNVTVHVSNRILFDSLVIRYEHSMQLTIPEIIRNCNFMVERTDF
uniref:Uncharacterized protein n=1 Tax=Romanomermis culicivorax TaxID=13658 RepID=A0A915I968_ROMCU